MKDMIAYAQGKLREAERNGTDMDMRYWAAYLDGVRATMREFRVQNINPAPAHHGGADGPHCGVR